MRVRPSTLVLTLAVAAAGSSAHAAFLPFQAEVIEEAAAPAPAENAPSKDQLPEMPMVEASTAPGELGNLYTRVIAVDPAKGPRLLAVGVRVEQGSADAAIVEVRVNKGFVIVAAESARGAIDHQADRIVFRATYAEGLDAFSILVTPDASTKGEPVVGDLTVNWLDQKGVTLSTDGITDLGNGLPAR